MNLLLHIDGLFRYAVVLTRNHSEAADLVQETYVRALKASNSLRPDSNEKNWLFTILRNIWLNELRRRRTSPKMLEIDAHENGAGSVVDRSDGPHEQLVNQAERERVRNAIQQLPVESREIIILREFEELSYQKISNLLKVPLGTVMSRLARARSRLRYLLSEERTEHANHRAG